MAETHASEPEQPRSPHDELHFSAAGFLYEVLHGVGVTLGLSFLWLMESIRNGYFWLLDSLGVAARRRRGTAFPPGQPRKRR